jgi:hypothetical protein
MNLHEAVTAAAPVSPAGSGKIRFLGKEAAYWRLLIQGALLLICTLGIYRFWLTTDVRRFLWSNTEIAGDRLEYTGTAVELLVGFLIAIAVLLPINALFFLAALDLGLIGKLSGVMGFLLLALLGQFALYRARRYRLSRTIYRGVRFYQTGSGLFFAFYALMWWGLIALTLGLAYPWAQNGLERFKMRNTYYGDLPGRFEASALSLFLRGLPLWLLTVGPLVGGLAAAVYSVDWPALAEAVREGGSGLAARVEASNPDYGDAIVFMIGAGGSRALSRVPGDDAALVERGPALWRRDGELAPAHRTSLPRVFPLPALRAVVRRRLQHRLRRGIRNSRYPQGHVACRRVAGDHCRPGAGARLHDPRAWLFHRLPGHREACALAAWDGIGGDLRRRCA